MTFSPIRHFRNFTGGESTPTNVLERLNKEVKRRTRVVEIVLASQAVMRQVGALLVEADEEWQVQRRCFSSKRR